MVFVIGELQKGILRCRMSGLRSDLSPNVWIFVLIVMTDCLGHAMIFMLSSNKYKGLP